MVCLRDNGTMEGVFCAWKAVSRDIVLLQSTYLVSVSLYFQLWSLEDGFLHCEIVEGSFRADTFVSFIQGLLENMQPFPQSNSVIVMDDSHIHKLPLIQEMISARYVGNLARYLVLTNPLPEASAVNFCPHPLQITTRSNSRSRG